MPAIFISHSSRDQKIAADITSALRGLGYEQVFLDFDKDTGIGAGADWERTLYEKLSRCHALILVLTPNWLVSTWCRIELAQARALGKIILPVICEPIESRLVLPEIQSVDLIDWKTDGFGRIERRLHAITDELARGFTLAPNRPPYPGIHAFEAEDAAIYFGRDDETRAVIERLDARRTQGGARFLLIIGASGAGKSSLLKAGVLPQLLRRRSQWVPLPPIRPEKAPLEAVAKAIAHHAGKPEAWEDWHARLKGVRAVEEIAGLTRNLRIGEARAASILLPIDQFEEAFTVAAAEERTAFLRLLAGVLDPALNLPVITVATGRADVMAGLLEASELAPLTETMSLLPVPLERVARLVEGPAAVAGLAVEKGLAERIVRDVESPDALPLLAFTLALLYARCSSEKRLTLNAYLALGDAGHGLNPVQNSVRLAADQAIGGLNASAQELAALRDAFVPHLVRLRLDDGRRLRQPAPLAALPRDAERLIHALTQARLLSARTPIDDGPSPTQGGAVVEVVHEALFAAWPTLAAWLDEEQAFLADVERLKGAHETWRQAPDAQKPQALLHGLLLARARDWLTKHPRRFVGGTLEPLRTFIAASAEVADAEQERARKLRRAVFQAVAAAAIIFAFAAVAASWLYYQAEEARSIANNERRIAVARQILATSQAEVGSNVECGLHLALVGYDAAKLASGLELLPFETAVRSALAHSRMVATLAEGITTPHNVSWRPDGTALAFTDDHGKVWLWTDDQRTAPRVIEGIGGEATGVEWRPGGQELLVATTRGIELWDTAEWKLTKSIPLRDHDLEAFRWNKDGTRLLARSARMGALLIDIDAGTSVRLAPPTNVWRGHAWSPDGRTAAVVTGKEVWVIRTEERTSFRLAHPEFLGSVAWSPDAKWIAVGLDGGQTWIWDAQTRIRQHTLSGHSNQVTALEFSPDSRNLVSASWDHSLIIWDTLSWRSKDKLTGHGAGVQDVRWSPSGASIASKASDGTIRLWSPKSSRTPLTWLETRGWVWNVGWSAERKILAAAADDEIVFRDDSGNRQIAKTGDHFYGGTWSASGDTYAFIEADGSFTALRASTGEIIVKKHVTRSRLLGIALAPDADMVALSSLEETLVLSLPAGEVRRRIQSPAAALAFSPAGKVLAYAPANGLTVEIMDVESGSSRSLAGGAPRGKATWGLAWSHDGERVATGSDDGLARVWSLAEPGQPKLLRGHGSDVKGVAWSPTGRQIATASLDGTIRLWELSEGRVIATLTGHTSGVRSVAWDKDGIFLASGAEDGTARMFHASFDHVLTLARRQITIGLTVPDRERCERHISPSADVR